ncbi:CG14931, partial [Drosophila busckii]
MELRSKTKEILKDVLKSAGVYEDGMNLDEMRMMERALKLSIESYESNELDHALYESEMESQILASSTMIVDPIGASRDTTSLDRDCDSPPSEPIFLQVQAQVHHELNWSPSKGARPPERIANEVNAECKSKRVLVCGDRNETENDVDVTPISLVNDSGVSSDQIITISSISDTSTVSSIGEMPSQFLISTSSAAVSDYSESDDEIIILDE